MDDRALISVLGSVTVVALVITDVGVNVLVVLIVGVAIVAIHGTFIGDEDLFVNQEGADAFCACNVEMRMLRISLALRKIIIALKLPFQLLQKILSGECTSQEKIGRLQLELQKLQFHLMKLQFQSFL
ncbi:hypothetical protein LINPERPRIM_LOCUS20674 [Linum perenne]